jgi:cephalosporin hydroxylase
MSDIRLHSILHKAAGLGLQQRMEEICALAGILLALKPRHILEVGAYSGASFWVWANLASGLRIAIDSGSLDGPIHRTWNQQFAQIPGTYLIRGDSQDPATVERARSILGGEPLDFLFLDGDHTLAGVQADLDAYGPLVRRGGYIGFHDITESDYHKNMNAGGAAEHWQRLVHPRKIHLDWADPGFGIGVIEVELDSSTNQ